MLLVALALATSQQSAPRTAWYGPETVTFWVQYAGDPHDADVNDVRIRFLDKRGNIVESLAYFDGEGYRAGVTASGEGPYRAVIVRNGVESAEKPEPEFLPMAKPAPNGFLRYDPVMPKRLRWDSGARFFPIGATFSDKLPEPATLAKLASAGMNFARVLPSSSAGRNPFIPINDPDPGPEFLWEPAMRELDRFASEANKNGVVFQVVLFDLRTISGGNWTSHPWNKANGGFLEEPGQFFTDAEALRRSKAWIRHAVARYGFYPTLGAWELFVGGNPPEEWRTTMIEALKGFDSQERHVVVTSQSSADLITGILNDSAVSATLPSEAALKAASLIAEAANLRERVPLARRASIRGGGATPAAGGGDWMMAQLRGIGPSNLTGLALPAGKYTLTLIDVAKGERIARRTVTVSGIDHVERIEHAGDTVAVFVPES